MEANLNQFRLLTVTGEERAGKDRRRSTGGAREGNGSRIHSRGGNGAPYDIQPDEHHVTPRQSESSSDATPGGTSPTKKSSPLAVSMNPPPGAVSSFLDSFTSSPQQGGMSPPPPYPQASAPEASGRHSSGGGDSASSGSRQGDERRPPLGGHSPALSEGGGVRLGACAHPLSITDCNEDAMARDEYGEEGLDSNPGLSPEKCLVIALRSLERSINNHCYLLNKKMKKERILKSPTERTAEPILPKTSAIRTDKVRFS
jgi:hypothetical protein